MEFQSNTTISGRSRTSRSVSVDIDGITSEMLGASASAYAKLGRRHQFFLSVDDFMADSTRESEPPPVVTGASNA